MIQLSRESPALLEATTRQPPKVTPIKPPNKPDSSPAISGPGEELVADLIEILGRSFDLSTLIGSRTLAAHMTDRIRSLQVTELPEWGSKGTITQVARLEEGPLDFYYRPHLFPDMDPALRLGHQLQFDLLPRRLPAASPVRVAAVLESYCHLSGDLLGWQLEDEELFLWVADVSGHGVRAGLAAAVLYFLVAAVDGHRQPAQFAQLINESMLKSRNRRDPRALFATAFWLRLTADGVGTYASCGHPPMLIKRLAGGVEGLVSTGPPIGLLADQNYQQHIFELEPGDRLCLFTDGLLEATDREGDEFGQDRLTELLSAHQGTALETTRAIYQAYSRFTDTTMLDDDLTLMVVEPA